MARNGSGTFTPSVDFTTEAASAPIEISKLDTALVDIGDELTNSIAADGQTNPTANLPMNGKRHTGVGAGAALTDYARVAEVISQGHTFWPVTGTNPDYVITPVPPITAYANGQKFAVQFNETSGASPTLNVNGLGARPIEFPQYLSTDLFLSVPTGTFSENGIYEFVYNTATDDPSGGSFVPVSVSGTGPQWRTKSTAATSLTISAGVDIGSIITFTANSAIAVTLGTPSLYRGGEIKLIQKGTGQITLSDGGGGPFGTRNKSAFQYAVVTLIADNASDDWLVTGDVIA